MERINTADGLFSDGTAAAGFLDGTVVTARWLNMLQAELISVLTAAGIALDGAKSDQLASAIQALQRGKTTVNVAGGASVNLTAAQYGMPILVLTGALTANINLIFPASSGAWVVRNQTTGNFTITCKTANGTGVVVSQGYSNALWGDGANLYAEQSDWANIALTGTPTAPTAAIGTSTTQLSNCAFVLANILAQSATAFTSGGAAPNFTLSPAPALAAYAANQRYRVKFHAAGAGNDTLNVSQLGAKLLKQYDDSGAKVAAVIKANQLADVEFDGVDFVILDPLPSSGSPAGEVTYFARNTPPAGWLKANGAAVSRTTYAALFAVIGTVFGAGDGATTFNLPDLRGEFVRGWDDGRGVDATRTFASTQTGAVETHYHSTDGTNGSNQHAVYYGSDGNFDYGRSASVSGADADYKAGARTGSYGSTETRPRNVALLACIKF